MNRITRIILIALTISLGYGIILYLIIEDDKKCDQHVVFTDGTEMDCTSVSSSDSGITTIKSCDKSIIKVPTQRIKVITELNDRN
jgi:hypothetical protein